LSTDIGVELGKGGSSTAALPPAGRGAFLCVAALSLSHRASQAAAAGSRAGRSSVVRTSSRKPVAEQMRRSAGHLLLPGRHSARGRTPGGGSTEASPHQR
jgi:hypothetical protein